jgi:alanyl-tRNA synthetase
MRVLFKEISEGESDIIEEIEMKDKCRFTSSEKYNEFFHQKFGGDLVKYDKKIAYCGIYEADNAVWIIVFCGEQSGKNAEEIVRKVAKILDGKGGGTAKFAKGAGKDTSKKDEAIAKAKSMILG